MTLTPGQIEMYKRFAATHQDTGALSQAYRVIGELLDENEQMLEVLGAIGAGSYAALYDYCEKYHVKTSGLSKADIYDRMADRVWTMFAPKEDAS